MWNTFEAGGVTRKVMKCKVDRLINKIYKGKKSLLSKESIVNFIQQSDTNSKEMAEIFIYQRSQMVIKEKQTRFVTAPIKPWRRKLDSEKKVHTITILSIFYVIVVIILSIPSGVVIFYFHWYCLYRIFLPSDIKKLKQIKAVMIYSISTYFKFE